MVTVHAAVLSRVGGDFTLQDFEFPKLDDSFLVVRISSTTTCGTDVHIWRGEIPVPMPIIPGHESIGFIESLGSNMRDYAGQSLKEGDRVIWNFSEPCNRCYICNIEGKPGSCPNRKAYGINISCSAYPYLNGCYAEKIIIGRNTPILKVNNSIEDQLLSPISCALSTVIKAIDGLNPNFLDRCLVLGAGPLGLYACAYLRQRGVRKILAVDLVQERLKLAQEFGADSAVDLSRQKDPESIKKSISELLGHEGPTLVLEVAGNPKAVDLGLELLGRGGRMAVVGSVVQGVCQFNPLFFVRKQVTLHGSLGYDARHMFEGLKFMEENVDKFPFKKLIGKSYNLSQLRSALQDMKERKIIKGVVKVSSQS